MIDAAPTLKGLSIILLINSTEKLIQHQRYTLLDPVTICESDDIRDCELGAQLTEVSLAEHEARASLTELQDLWIESRVRKIRIMYRLQNADAALLFSAKTTTTQARVWSAISQFTLHPSSAAILGHWIT